MKRIRIAIALSGALAALLTAGCGDKKEDAPTAPTAEPLKSTNAAPDKTTTPPPMAADKDLPAPSASGGTPAAPFASGGGSTMTAEEALKQVPTLDPKFVPMQRDLADKEVVMKQSPNDAKAKAAYVEAAYNYGHKLVLGPTTAPQTVQYRAALALYRRALKVDPRHEPSLAETKTIEDIYTQMGRPIPK